MTACDPLALTELFFGELPPEEAASLQRHAHGCDACRRTLSELREDRGRFGSLRRAPPRLDALFEKVQAGISARRPPRVPRTWLAPSLVPLVGGCLALLLAVIAPTVPQGAGWSAQLESVREAQASACFSDRADDGSGDPGVSADSGDPQVRLSACLIAAPPLASERAQACF